ncbi:putative gluconokinase [Escovopsis weberi]|uniref:Gluconokinase n=1 Tax=Escovopsis weberi TaxID=150374 RepID=A0A0M9VRH7_ESCWE|nr:putative gluconokinase [Escovopsis weberi]
MLSYDAPGSLKGQDSATATSLASTIKAAAAVNNASFKSIASNGTTMMSSQTKVQSPAQTRAHAHTHILLVTGPAGCGKTTVAEHLAASLNMPYIEGDLYHTTANIEKMRAGIPLTDADRWDWLTILREESIRRINQGSAGVIVTCSALKRKYRDVIRVAAYYDHHILIHFIYLDAPEEVLLQRVGARQGHYMGANMVHSQLDILEVPSQDETDVTTIDVSRDIDEVVVTALDQVSQFMTSNGTL